MEVDEEDFWKCRKHPSRPRQGVCPSCLRDRLLLLCPDCREILPCGCLPTSSSSSSSASSLSSFDPPRSSVSGGIGTIGRVSSLIESEPAFRRSRSAAFGFLRPRSDEERGKKWGNMKIWGMILKRKEEEEQRSEMEEKLWRSRSIGIMNCKSDSGESRRMLKGRKWHFPSPMRAFWQKKPANIDMSTRKDSASLKQKTDSDSRTIVKLDGTSQKELKKPGSGSSNVRTIVKLDWPKPEELFALGTLYFLKRNVEDRSGSMTSSESYTLWKRQAGEHFQRGLKISGFKETA